MGVRDTLGEVSLGEDELEMKQAAREMQEQGTFTFAENAASSQEINATKPKTKRSASV